MLRRLKFTRSSNFRRVLLANKMVASLSPRIVKLEWTVSPSLVVRTAKKGIFNLYAFDGTRSSKAQVETGK